jgi:hypothetical protein
VHEVQEAVGVGLSNPVQLPNLKSLRDHNAVHKPAFGPGYFKLILGNNNNFEPLSWIQDATNATVTY